MTTAATPALQRGRQLHPLHVRRATVSRVEPLGGRMRRVTLDLEAGAPPIPWVPLAVGDHVKVAFPHPSTGELILPTVVDDRPRLPEGASRPVTRDYTVRGVEDARPDGSQQVSIDLVVHGTGPASTWASSAGPGDVVGLLGPRGSMTEPPAPGDYVWAAGQAGAMVQVRRAAGEMGIGDESLHPSALQVDGYWRRGVAGRDHHEPLES